MRPVDGIRAAGPFGDLSYLPANKKRKRASSLFPAAWPEPESLFPKRVECWPPRGFTVFNGVGYARISLGFVLYARYRLEKSHKCNNFCFNKILLFSNPTKSVDRTFILD
jgi:hypothetical protein